MAASRRAWNLTIILSRGGQLSRMMGASAKSVMWVQPIVWQPIFLLKPIRATSYRFIIKKSEEPCRGVFFGAVFFRAVFSIAVFFQKKKEA